MVAAPRDDGDVPDFLAALGLPGLADVHVHFMPPRVMAAVWRHFDLAGPFLGREWPVRYKATDEERVERLRALGVRRFTALPYAHKPGIATFLNEWAWEFAASVPECLPSATFFPEPEAGKYVAAAIEQGVEVFKAHVQVGDFELADPYLRPVWGALEDAGVPLVLHAGSGPVPNRHTGPEPVAGILRSYPRLALVIAHAGAPEYREFLELAERYERVMLDTTMVFTDFFAGFAPYPPELLDRFAALREKVLFGSDFPTFRTRTPMRSRRWCGSTSATTGSPTSVGTTWPGCSPDPGRAVTRSDGRIVVVTNVAAVTDLDQHPMLQAARQLADDLLEPSATEVDAGLVPRSHLEAIGRAGLLGLVAPAADGGAEVPAAVWRRVQEVLSGADCATWFVTAQHHGPVRMLAESSAPIRSDLLPQLVRGELVAGTAFAHLRGWPDRPVEATRVEGGWRFRGMAPWYTGWGLNDVLSLGGASADGEVVFGIVNARPRPGLIASAPMRMAAMTATQTVRLALDNVVIPDSHIVQRMPIQEWLPMDQRQTVNTNPAVFGVAAASLRKLRELAAKADLPAASAAADRLASRLASVRERSERLHETVSPDDAHAERLAVRAEAQRVLVDATTALVVAGGGRSMALTSAGQRHAREALFLLVQAQTMPARESTLATF